VRVLAHPARGVRHVNTIEQRERLPSGLTPACSAMPDNGLGNLLADAQMRRERGHRVLEDEADPCAADAVERLLRPPDERLAAQAGAARHPGRRGQKPHCGEEKLALAGA